jgi:hypothetical protein
VTGFVSDPSNGGIFVLTLAILLLVSAKKPVLIVKDDDGTDEIEASDVSLVCPWPITLSADKKTATCVPPPAQNTHSNALRGKK